MPLALAAAAARAGSRPPGHITRLRSHSKEGTAILYFDNLHAFAHTHARARVGPEQGLQIGMVLRWGIICR